MARLQIGEIERQAPAPDRDRLDKVQEMLAQVDSQLAGFSNDLRPRVLDDLGLIPAIEFLAQRFSSAGGIPIRVEAMVSESVPHRIGITLYRAVQEGLTNIIRHSHAMRATIRLQEQVGMITCHIWDDGIGFDPSEVLAARGQRGLGLIAIRNSARLSGGTATFHSTPGQGTELRLSLWRSTMPECTGE